MNNSFGKTVELNLSFLRAGNYEIETWSDTKKSDKVPGDLKRSVSSVKSPGILKVTMSKNGGFTGIIKQSEVK